MTQNPDPEVLARALLDDLLNCLSPGDLMCIPTGRSPRNLYRLIREDSGNAPLWSSLRYLQLDEYLDPSGTIPSFRDELREQIFDPLGVPHNQVFSIDPAGDPHSQANRLDPGDARDKACMSPGYERAPAEHDASADNWDSGA